MKRTASLLLVAVSIVPLAFGPALAAPVAKEDAKVCATLEAGTAKGKKIDCVATGSIETGAKVGQASKVYPSGPVNPSNGIWF